MNLDIVVGLCKRFEGVFLKPYRCPAGIPTIGIGSTLWEDGTPVKMDDAPITMERALSLFLLTLKRDYAPGTVRQCPGLLALGMTTGNWAPLNAIVDFAYNCGVGRLQTSTLRRKLNAQDWEGAREQLMLYVRGGGRVLPGLVRRRQAESVLLPQ